MNLIILFPSKMEIMIKTKKNILHKLWLYSALLLFGNIASGQSGISNFELEISRLIHKNDPVTITILAKVEVDTNKKDSGYYTRVGTGLYLNNSGYVATRSTIVRGAKEVRARLWDGNETNAEIIGYDQKLGTALLRINAPTLPEPEYANPRSIKTGDWVLIIGNMPGSPTVSIGLISKILKSGIMQINVPVKPGTNGAPVINASGQVVGMIAGEVASSGSQESHMLALPVKQIYKSAHHISRDYARNKGYIGITVHRGIYKANTPQIIAVASGSPAQKAKLEIGDVILQFNGENLDGYHALKELVKAAAPGDKLTFTVLRKQEKRDVDVHVSALKYENIFQNIPYMPFEAGYNPVSSAGKNTNSERFLQSRLKQMELELERLKNLFKKSNEQ